MNNMTNGLRIKQFARAFAANRQGVTAIEYGLIAGLIAVGIVTTVAALSNNLVSLFTTIMNSVGAA
jgi:pilus assembly protein Flp/PilA